MARESPLRRLLPKLVVLVGSLVIAIVLAEVALRVLRPSAYRVWPPGLTAEFHPTPELLPGVSGTSRFVINREGMRAGEPPSGDAYKILTVGGSTTECLFLNQDEAWPHLLEERLGASGRPTFVGNVGKSGHASRQHLLQIIQLLPQHPDVKAVVLLVGVNDLQAALQGSIPRDGPFELPDYFKAFMVVPRERVVPEWAPAYARTQLYGLLFAGAPPVHADAIAKDLVQDTDGKFYVNLRAKRHASPVSATLPALDGSLAAFRRTLDAAATAVKERGARLVLMTQPVLWKQDLAPDLDKLLWFGWGPSGSYYAVPALAEAMSRYNQVTLEVCRTRGIECIDLANQVPQNTTTFYDDCHFNESGARRVAEVVAKHFLSRAPYRSGAGAE